MADHSLRLGRFSCRECAYVERQGVTVKSLKESEARLPQAEGVAMQGQNEILA